MVDFKAAILEFKRANVLVIGDVILDHYTFGEVERISPEAPIPIVHKKSEKFTLGGAANVANNLAALGARTSVAGILGSDPAKDLVFKLLKEKNIGTECLLVRANHPTIEKHRIIAGDGHQLLRLDIEHVEHLTPEEEATFFELASPAIKTCDAVIFSDYAKGLFSLGLAQKLIALAKRAGKLMLADFKPQNRSYFPGVDVVLPNLKEAREMAGFHELEAIGPSIVSEFAAHVAITRGGDGISIFRREDASHHHVPGKKIKVFDVSGAGDTSIAVLALGLVAGLNLEHAAVLANEAGAIVVQKPGTATLSPEELASALQTSSHVENIGVVPKVWGHEKWLENNEKYCCKLLTLNKGYQCSLHYHKKKDETFLVTSGHVRLELNGQVTHLRPGSFVRIPPETPHRFAGIEDSVIIEISTHHDEEDSYRLEESRKMDLSSS